jgi:GNAT superfamily N-acetyltransferase
VLPTDLERLAEFAQGLSYGTRYFRFGRGDIRFSQEDAAIWCNPDPRECHHWIAVVEQNATEIQIASASIHFEENPDDCEMAMVVTDAWQGSGLAHWLLTVLMDSARQDGFKRMRATVLATNTTMLKFARRHGFVVVSELEQAPIKTLILELQATG